MTPATPETLSEFQALVDLEVVPELELRQFILQVNALHRHRAAHDITTAIEQGDLDPKEILPSIMAKRAERADLFAKNEAAARETPDKGPPPPVPEAETLERIAAEKAEKETALQSIKRYALEQADWAKAVLFPPDPKKKKEKTPTP